MSNAWRLSKTAKPFCVPCCSTRNMMGLVLKAVQQDVGFEEKGNRLERKIDVAKLEMNESGISSDEGRTCARKIKGKGKSVKVKPALVTPVGDMSRNEREVSSKPAKLHSNKCTSGVSKTERSVVIFPASKALPNPPKVQRATLSQETDRSVSQSEDVDNTQEEKTSKNRSLPGEGEELFSNTPSILGILSSDRDRKIQHFLKAGFSESDARFVFPYLPLCLESDFRVAHRVVSLLEKHKLNWRLLLKWNAVCFTMEPKHVSCEAESIRFQVAICLEACLWAVLGLACV